MKKIWIVPVIARRGGDGEFLILVRNSGGFFMVDCDDVGSKGYIGGVVEKANEDMGVDIDMGKMFGFLQDENGIRLYFYAGVMEMDVRDYDMGEYIWVGLGKMRDYLDGEEVEVVSRGLMKLY